MPRAPWRQAMPMHSKDACVRLRRDNSNGRNGVSKSENSLPPGGSTLQQAFEALVTTLNERGVRYAIIGGIATLQHTRLRTTEDIDAMLTVPQMSLPGLFEALGARGFVVDLMKNIREFRDQGLTAIRRGDVIVDLMRPVLPAYAHVLDRAITGEIMGMPVRVSSAESLVVMKLISLRPQDEADIQDLLATYRDKLDLAYVRGELADIFDSADPRWAKLDEWVRRANE
jgi:hypothetical protein